MTYENLLKNVSKHITLDSKESDLFTSLLSCKELRKKHSILQEGQAAHYIYYVHSGALRAFHIDRKGKESTIMFAVADWWVTDMHCFINRQPAMMHIETIADSCVFQLSGEHMEQLYQYIPKFERFFRILFQNAYIREQLRVIENLSLTAEERYDNFLNKYAHIAKAVSQKQIASYLGITPEFLSSIRLNKSRKKIS